MPFDTNIKHNIWPKQVDTGPSCLYMMAEDLIPKFPFAAITATSLLESLSSRFCNVAIGICQFSHMIINWVRH